MNNSVDDLDVTPDAGGEDEVPDWLKELAPSEPPSASPAAEQAPSDESASEDLPAWLRELVPSKEVPPTPKSSVLPARPAEPPVETQPASLPETAEVSEPETRDEAIPEEISFAPIEQPILPEEEASFSAPASSAVSNEETSGLPDWLSELTPPVSAEPPTPQAPAAPEGKLEPEGIPAWLRELAQPPNVAPTTEPTETGAPSWITTPLSSTPPIPSEEPSPGLSEAAQVMHEQLEAVEPPVTRPAVETPPASVAAGTAVGAKEEEAQQPDWTRELAPPVGLDQEETSALSLDQSDLEELPDWLRETRPASGDSKRRGKTPGEPSGAESVPAWVGALKPPVGEALPEVTETTGPLAGIRGVLPIAYDLTQPIAVPEPPPVRSSGARMFESVLAAPAAATTVAPSLRAARTARPWVNLVIYLLVLLAAVAAVFIPSDMAGLGLTVDNQTPTAGFHDKLQSLRAGSTVLLAFDYETGQTVELNPAARAIVQDLARRQINVVAISTVPVGPQIARSILLDAARQYPDWQPGVNFINVGYLPGAESGLRNLAQNWLPAGRIDFEKETVNTLPLGAKLKGLGDFALVIEFAGQDEFLRRWMEQVQPYSTAPIVAAVSAGVESSARNYRNANQLAAFVRGLQGAAEYELFSNQPGLSVRIIDAQSFIQLVMAGIIVLGNVIFWYNRFQKTRTEKAHALAH